MSETTTNKRRSNGLTHRREHGRGPISLPSICILLVHTQRGRSIGCDELVGSSISPSHHTLKLFIGPSIEIHGLDSADMRSHTPVNSRAPNANKDTQVPRRPSRIYPKDNSVYECQEIASEMKPAWAQLKEGIGDHSRLFRLQSAHILLGSSFSRALIVCEFWAAWPGVGRRDIIAATQESMCERVRETMRAT
jgi:hypothetical protein